ncbi:MAG: DsbA family oxidoreductase, partial [Caulobacteraceae bacterium]
MKTVPIIYFSDVLCVWAYIAQLRLDEAQAQFGEQIAVEKRFCSVFGDTARKMQTQWAAKSGYEGFNAHLRQAVQAFPEVELNPDIWLTVRPSSSVSPHLFLKAT